MPKWTIDKPDQLTFDPVDRLSVRIVAGHLAVLASDGPPSLEISEIGADPLFVDHEDGHLTVTYGDLSWEGVLGWLRPGGGRRCTITLTVPKTCRVEAGVISAGAVVAGFEARTRVRSVSGDIVLDGVSGDVNAETVSGSVESRALAGDLSFTSVSGELTVADGAPRRLRANTVNGTITADIALDPTSHVTLNTVAGPIWLRLPRVTDGDVAFRSMSGNLESAFPGLTYNSHPGSRSLTGRLGGGMASLNATTVSGGVTLLSKETE
ncbi:DUF4097 family beta strand repeat-containing protein [Herbidospora mongoliensis]|uniref:DUF4097 family beta strand repeat-containing protein n=1 Tax=Herbidospora mongoliensis TaxID=688067 RepID=UPI00082F430E|nr:DUF4097 family beta strand repeat-containing protein [Herbidospora mongoliensis]